MQSKQSQKISLDKRFYDALIEIYAYAPSLKSLTELKKQLMIVLPSELRTLLTNKVWDSQINETEMAIVKLWNAISGVQLILTNDEKV